MNNDLGSHQRAKQDDPYSIRRDLWQLCDFGNAKLTRTRKSNHNGSNSQDGRAELDPAGCAVGIALTTDNGWLCLHSALRRNRLH